EDVAPAFEALNDPIGALYVCSDPLTLTNRIRINTLALSARLPTIYGAREYVEAGGLMSYGPNFLDLYRRSASYVDKILRGTKPADIPVEQPTKFDFIVNLLTAKALRLTIPPTWLPGAKEVFNGPAASPPGGRGARWRQGPSRPARSRPTAGGKSVC